MNNNILNSINNLINNLKSNKNVFLNKNYQKLKNIYQQLVEINENIMENNSDNDDELIQAEISYQQKLDISNGSDKENKSIICKKENLDDDECVILDESDECKINSTIIDFEEIKEDDNEIEKYFKEENNIIDVSTIVQEEKSFEEIFSEDDEKYIDVLKRYFGHSKFRPLQLKIIKNVIENKRDNLVVMATGQGKSLCYQYPALYLNSLTVVISPLISLMEDQVKSLKMVNVEACFLGTAQENDEEVRKKLFNGQVRVLYLTPEFVDNQSDFLERLNERKGICLVAIDECHVVSQWGNDFRPAYRKVGEILRKKLINVPFMALTATATPNVRKDIINSLMLQNPFITITSFDRPNLYMTVSYKSSNIINDLKTFMYGENKMKFDGPTIIYCQSKKLTEEVVHDLNLIGIKCDYYHADLAMVKRKEVQKRFLSDEIDVIVATVAFGMGIDKPDIKNVIHYGAPKDLEGYYQEIGRAGRDGLQSKCHVFFNESDFEICKYLINKIKIQIFRDHKMEMMHKMAKFLTTSQCRRRFLLMHFNKNEKLLTDTELHEFCCDNCTEKLNKRKCGVNTYVDEYKDFSSEAKVIFNSIKLFNEKFGMNTIISYILGSKSQKLINKIPHSALSNPLYNSAKIRNERWWSLFGQQLIIEGYLKENGIPGYYGSTLELKNQAKEFLDNESEKLLLIQTNEMKKLTSTPIKLTFGPLILPMIPTNSISSYSNPNNKKLSPEEIKNENELYKLLLTLRNDIASELGLSTHKIASNQILQTLARIRPSCIKNLDGIEDFANEKVETVGLKFVNKIKNFCEKNNLRMDNFDTNESDNNVDALMSDPKIINLLNKLPNAKRAGYEAFEFHKKSIEEISAMRGIVQSTVYGYLESAILVGLPLNYLRLNISNETIDHVEDVIRKPPINSNVSRLSSIKEKCTDISWDHLKIIVALIKKKYGMIGNDDNEKLAEKQCQTTLAVNDLKVNSPKANNNSQKSESRPLPNWFKKRALSVNDNDKYSNKNNSDKYKKKPKFQL